MPYKYLITIIVFFSFSWKTNASYYSEATDTTSIWKVLSSGSIHTNVRYFYMNTDNSGDNYDAFAHGLNMGISYETKAWKNFSFGISSQWMYNLGSSSLSPDPKFPILNRYEIGLFDVLNPLSTNILSRLEKLYLNYNYQKSNIKIGRQIINSPFVNAQDGRLRPTMLSGIWLDWNEISKTKIELGYLGAISPRGTTQWFSIGESMGIYPQGVNPDGNKSNYYGNIESKGIAMLGITLKQLKTINFQFWNMYVDRVMNTHMLQADGQWPSNLKGQWVGGIQYLEQHALEQGGNPDQSKTYMTAGSMSRSWGARFGWENKQWKTSINFNRITNEGRYLMPREWGKDPFYTFLPRERNEGFGNVHAFVAKMAYQWKKIPLRTQLAQGYFYLPPTQDFVLNKYALPSYAQTNLELNFEPQGKWKGMTLSLIYVLKNQIDESKLADKFEINKVNMSHINVILNYTL